jgi:hypothetical protein
LPVEAIATSTAASSWRSETPCRDWASAALGKLLQPVIATAPNSKTLKTQWRKVFLSLAIVGLAIKWQPFKWLLVIGVLGVASAVNLKSKVISSQG